MTVTLEEAQQRLPDLIAAAMRGEEVLVTRNDQPAAKIIGIANTSPTPGQPRVFGSAKGKIVISDNFDMPLEEFEEYME